MNNKQKGPVPPPITISWRDACYIYFRHKWLTLSLIVIGLLSSLAVQTLWPFPYISKAKIYVRYIQDTMAPAEVDGGAKVKSPDGGGVNVLNTELQILTSTDLALQVVTNVGADRILGKSGSSNNFAAAAFISDHLKAEVEPNSDVIVLTFSASNPDVVQQVLLSLISVYKSKYYEIHLAPGVSDDYLEKRTDEANANLQQALKTLKEVKIRTGITSLEDAKKNAANLLAVTKEDIFQTQSQLAEMDANIKDLQDRVSGAPARPAATNSATNSEAAALPPPPSPEMVSRYQMLNRILDSDRAREQELLVQFTTNNVKVQGVEQQLKQAEADVKKYEMENPGLLAFKPTEENKTGNGPSEMKDPTSMLQEAITRRHSLAAKFGELTNQMERLRGETAELDGTEEQITKAQSDTETAEAKLKRYQLSIEQNNIDEAVGNKVSNISTIEMPTPPGHDDKKIPKLVWGGVLGSFLVLAFGLPLFIELVFDQSFKHASDVQNRIEGVPFFITLPRMQSHRKRARIEKALVIPRLGSNGEGAPGPSPLDAGPPAPANGQVAPWDHRHELRPFYETLRDRMMTYFEMVNLTHKPKLVAVTSCADGAGVTTTAAGLAASLSETGEGNVLLVSMNTGDGEAQHFRKGKLAIGIEDVLGKEKRGPAQVNENLFFADEVGGSEEKLPRMLPKRFSHLLPMMKASDFDYIIFDMPPMSEISITPRLARFMDMVLLVIESEKTPREAALRAATMLKETKTNVGLVLNKNRSYVPKVLEQSL